LHSFSATLAQRFKAAGIVAQKRSARRKDGRIEGSSTGANEDWCLFEKRKLLALKAELAPIE
jgi:hypothetical protein